MRYFTFFLLTAFFLLVTICGTSAQKLDIASIKDIPSYAEEMSVETFYQQSDVYEEELKHERTLSYRIRLPYEWTKIDEEYNPALTVEEVERLNRHVLEDLKEERNKGKDQPPVNNNLSQRVLVKVATYFSPAKVGYVPSRLEIRALKLDRDITVKNWFLQYIISNGFVLQGMKTYADGRVEGLYALVEKDYSYYVRSMVQMNGPRITMVSYYLPERMWKEERAAQEHTIRSFRFTSPDKTKVELNRTYEFFDMVYFDYPSIWQLMNPNVFSIESMDATLVLAKDKETLAGQIDIHIFSTELDTTLPEEIRKIKEDIGERDLKVGDVIDEPTGYDFKDHIYFNRIEVYHANNKKGTFLDYEFWLAVMAESRYYYIVTMLTPSRQSDFQTWATNTESFETIIESFRPGE